MREYLDLEFREIETILPFDYNLERIIDDFILLAVFIGNDFLPHLPDVHIHENGLERLFEIYKQVLPSLGVLNLNLWGRCIFLTNVQMGISTTAVQSTPRACRYSSTECRNGNKKSFNASTLTLTGSKGNNPGTRNPFKVPTPQSVSHDPVPSCSYSCSFPSDDAITKNYLRPGQDIRA